MADGLMASAAYYIGSQASELVASPSSLLGSVGVYQQHVDYSRALDKEGVTITFISSSPEKTAGNSYEPLGDAGRKQLQGIV
ncbi:S49 family peptidase, partial [Streptococcus pneumoniae]|uniref:S49 family peptidase n=1 Tax=Streptococcus pneumoniae TaxID=1313 RepID=UPI002E7ABA6E